MGCDLDLSAEQEAEIERLRADLGSATFEEAVLAAVRVLMALREDVRLGGRIVVQTPDGATTLVNRPELEIVDQPYGTIEGVSFTVAQAHATVALANTASFEALDREVALDRRAAKGLVAGRPFATVEALGGVAYVGPSALAKLRDFAGPSEEAELLSTKAALEALAVATEGLVWVSDIDEVLTVVSRPGVSAIDETNAKTVLADIYVPREGEVGFDDRLVEQVPLGRLLDGYTVERDYWGEEQRAPAEQWRALRAIFETGLANATGLRLGEYAVGNEVGGAMDIYVLGTTGDGDLVGFHSISVVP